MVCKIMGGNYVSCRSSCISFNPTSHLNLSENNASRKLLINVKVKKFIKKESCGSRKAKGCKRQNQKVKLVEEI